MSSVVSELAQDLLHEASVEWRASIRAWRGVAATYASVALLPVILFTFWSWIALYAGPLGALIVTFAVLGLPLAYGFIYCFSMMMRLAPPIVAMHERERYRIISGLKQKIATYARRELDWDGMGGRAPSARATAEATRFLDQLPHEAPEPERTYAPGDGEIMFQWHRNNAFVEVGFYGDGTISWFARASDGTSSHGDELYRDVELPANLLSVLQSIR